MVLELGNGRWRFTRKPRERWSAKWSAGESSAGRGRPWRGFGCSPTDARGEVDEPLKTRGSHAGGISSRRSHSPGAGEVGRERAAGVRDQDEESVDVRIRSGRAQRFRARSDEWRGARARSRLRSGRLEERRLGRGPNPNDVDHEVGVGVDQEQGLVMDLTHRAIVGRLAPEVVRAGCIVAVREFGRVVVEPRQSV